jgi:hypothetical protein
MTDQIGQLLKNAGMRATGLGAGGVVMGTAGGGTAGARHTLLPPAQPDLGPLLPDVGPACCHPVGRPLCTAVLPVLPPCGPPPPCALPPCAPAVPCTGDAGRLAVANAMGGMDPNNPFSMMMAAGMDPAMMQQVRASPILQWGGPYAPPLHAPLLLHPFALALPAPRAPPLRATAREWPGPG